LLLKYCPSEKHVNFKSRDGSTPLHIAVKRRESKLIKILLKNGAQTRLVDCVGKSSVDYNPDVIKLQEQLWSSSYKKMLQLQKTLEEKSEQLKKVLENAI